MTANRVEWPQKYEVLRVRVSAAEYNEAVDCIVEAARRGQAALASFYPAHGIVSSDRDERLLERVNSFDLIGADGQSVRWALNALYGLCLAERVYGPETMLRVCERAAAESLPVYLYGGSSDAVLDALSSNLLERFPGLQIAGAESPPFRPLTSEEDSEVVRRVRESGAKILFVGIGCPKQEHFAYEHRESLGVVQLCVGAAFDFHAGVKPMAPSWMQRRGLEWLFRLASEPRRLAGRYVSTNSLFVAGFAQQWVRQRVRGEQARSHTQKMNSKSTTN
ncbi:MAG: WecB/TagA/CpsF family glycosyltransferase [Planctomycetota bacterium]